MRLSIVVTCYNDGSYLPDCLKSIEAIEIEDVELIIVNDGSTEKATLNYLRSLENEGYKVINKANGGVSSARNHGISEAKNDLILLVDADDCIEPQFIHKAFNTFLKNPSTAVVYGNVSRFGQSTAEYKPGEFHLIQMLSGNFIPISALFKKELWEKVRGFDTSLNSYEDWDFWLRLADQGALFAYIDALSLHYRDRENSRNSNSKNPLERKKIVREIVSKNKSLYHQKYSEVIAHLHLTLAQKEIYEENLEAALEKSNQVELVKKITTLEQQIIDLKNYYEQSIFWKFKLMLEKIYKK